LVSWNCWPLESHPKDDRILFQSISSNVVASQSLSRNGSFCLDFLISRLRRRGGQ
jgi:hypothetical protein